MSRTRREFIRLSALLAAGMSLPAKAQSPLKLLILGGTGFVGPHMVRYAVSRGHQVSIFTRGNKQLDVPGIEYLVGDRNNELSALTGRTWDVVLDNNSRDYRWVQASTELLRGVAEHYILISSISAYAIEGFGYENWQRMLWEPMVNESTTRVSPPEGWSMGDEATYGLTKALSEDIVHEAFPNRCAIVRPGLIVGPGDPTDRFTYWPVRLDEGGEILAPGNPNHANQIIDQRDLTEWMIRLGDGTEESHQRIQESVNRLWEYTGECFESNSFQTAAEKANVLPHAESAHREWMATITNILSQATLTVPNSTWMQKGGRQGRHSEHLSYILAEMQVLPRTYPDAQW